MMSQMTQFLIAHGGLFLFLIVFADQSGLPFPAVPWLLAAGALAATGRMSMFTAICWTVMGSLAADATWFYIGHHGKGWLLKLFPRLRAVQRAAIQKTPVRSIARALRILSAAKFLPFGTLVPLRAGALNVSARHFVLLDAVSSVFYASVCVLLGFFFHGQLEQLVALIKRFGLLSFALLVVLVAACVSYRFLKRSKKDRGRSEQQFLGFGEALAKEEAGGNHMTEPPRPKMPVAPPAPRDGRSLFENALKGRLPKLNEPIPSAAKLDEKH